MTEILSKQTTFLPVRIGPKTQIFFLLVALHLAYHMYKPNPTKKFKQLKIGLFGPKSAPTETSTEHNLFLKNKILPL